MHALRGLYLQVINTSISPQTIYIFYDWQNAFSYLSQNNVIVPSVEAIIINNTHSSYVESILSSQESQSKVKYMNIRLYFRNLDSQ